MFTLNIIEQPRSKLFLQRLPETFKVYGRILQLWCHISFFFFFHELLPV